MALGQQYILQAPDAGAWGPPVLRGECEEVFVFELSGTRVLLFFYFFISSYLIADGPHHYHPVCGHKGSSHLSPVHTLQFFF